MENILKPLKKYFFIFTFLVCGVIAFAHPHMLFSSTEEFVFEEDKLVGCWLEWTFDSYFIAYIIYTYEFDINNGEEAICNKVKYDIENVKEEIKDILKGI